MAAERSGAAKVDVSGHWSRDTHGDIRETALERKDTAAEHLADYDSEHKQVRQHSLEEIAGLKLIEALGALRLLSGGTANLSALDNLNLTTASDLNSTAARDLKELVGNIAERVAKIKQVIKVEDGGTIWLGNESHNVLQLLSDLIGVVKTLAEDLATHKHLGVTAGSGTSLAPENSESFTSAGKDVEFLREKLSGIKG